MTFITMKSLQGHVILPINGKARVCGVMENDLNLDSIFASNPLLIPAVNNNASIEKYSAGKKSVVGK